MLPVEQPFKTYTGLDGKPLNNGYVYFGQPNQDPITHPVEVYLDADGTMPAGQPLRTVNGYIVTESGSPTNVFFDGAYSELVRDSKQRQVFYARTSEEFSIALAVSTFLENVDSAVGSSLIGFIQAGAGAVKRTVQDKLRETISVADFPSLAAAITSFNGENGRLVVAAPIEVAASLAIPTNIALEVNRGAVITVAAGETLTINGPFSAGLYQTFAGAGTIAGLRCVLSPAWWGASPTNIDNSAALMALRQSMLADNEHVHQIEFSPGGLYSYSVNKWLLGVKHVVIKAYGVTFRCTGNNVYDRDNKPLYVSDIFEDYGNSLTYPGDVAAWRNTGARIATIAAGSSTVTTINAGDASNFAAGDLVLVHGFDQQQVSYPPNVRYFDYRVVRSVDVGTGAIVLDRQLANDYDSRWWDYTFNGISFGAARIIKLDATQAYPRLIKIAGAKFAPNPNKPNDGFVQLSGLEFEWKDCDFRGMTAVTHSMHEKINYINCKFDSLHEPDKIVVRASYDDCHFGPSTKGGRINVSSGVGHDRMDFNRCTFDMCNILLSPRHQSFEKCIFNNCAGSSDGLYSVIGDQYGTFPSSSLSVRDSQIRSSLTYDRPTIYSATYTSMVAAGAAGQLILIDKASAGLAVVRDLQKGAFIYKNDLSNYGTVTNIYSYDATRLAVEATLIAAPVAGDRFYWSLMGQVTLDNVTYGRSGLLRETNLGERNVTGSAHLFRSHSNVNWSATARENTTFLEAIVKKLSVSVTKPYTGAASASLEIYRNIAGAGMLIGRINLKVAGDRAVDSLTVAGAQAGDSLAIANLFKPSNEITMYVLKDGAGSFAGDPPGTLPEFYIDIEYLPLGQVVQTN